MPGENAEISRCSRDLRLGGLVAHEQALGSDDFNLERVSHELRGGFHLLSVFQNFVDRTFHIESLLRHVVVLAFNDLLEAAHRILNLDVASCVTGELFGHVEWLRQELLDFPGASYSDLIVFGKLVDSQNGDDVLQIFITLQDSLYSLGNVVVFLAHYSRSENS